MEFKFDVHDEDAMFNDWNVFVREFNMIWEDHFNTREFEVNTENDGWRGRSGRFEKTYENGEEFLGDVTDGIHEFNLEVTINDDKCTIVLYSHDNPMGATFTAYPV